MGKGDQRSKRGKIRAGSYGNSRRRRKARKTGAAPAVNNKPGAKKPAKKAAKKAE